MARSKCEGCDKACMVINNGAECVGRMTTEEREAFALFLIDGWANFPTESYWPNRRDSSELTADKGIKYE